MGKSRAVNMFVDTILGDFFSIRHTPEQLVLALHTASKHPHVRMFFKSAGLTDVEDLEAMRFHHQQINSILKTTNESKKKSSGTDDIRSYEQSIYSAMAESPPSSNRAGTVRLVHDASVV
jgi:methylphosphotriester-DNA--protein-cysteine methyltransferase